MWIRWSKELVGKEKKRSRVWIRWSIELAGKEKKRSRVVDKME